MKLEDAQHQFSYQKGYFRRNQLKYPLRVLAQPRKCQAYCIGTPKSGTHSIASLLERYRSDHEPDEIFLIQLLNYWKKKAIPIQEVKRLLKQRDATNWLEVESSHYIGNFVEPLKELFPKAKFILTIRDCISWCDSWFNHQLSRKFQDKHSVFTMGRANYYDTGFSFTQYEKHFEALGLFPLKAYFNYWCTHNNAILSSIESEKLLTIKTGDISTSGKNLSQFLGIDETTLNLERSHAYKAKFKHDILRSLDKNFLIDTASQVCGELNDNIFPEKTIAASIDAIFND